MTQKYRVIKGTKEHTDYVISKLAPLDDGFGPNISLTIIDGTDTLNACIIYHNYCKTFNTIEMTAYSEHRGWNTKEMTRLIYDYAFTGMGVRLVMARHSENNKRARRIWNALGAKEYVIPDIRAEGEADVIAVLDKKTWNGSRFKRGDR